MSLCLGPGRLIAFQHIHINIYLACSGQPQKCPLLAFSTSIVPRVQSLKKLSSIKNCLTIGNVQRSSPCLLKVHFSLFHVCMSIHIVSRPRACFAYVRRVSLSIVEYTRTSNMFSTRQKSYNMCYRDVGALDHADG